MQPPSELPSPEHYANIEEYIRDRLSIAERPLSPSGIADEYSAGNIHARKELSRLCQEGVVDRVSRGQYTLSDSSDSSGSVTSHGNSHGIDGDTTAVTDVDTNDKPSDTTQSYKSTADMYPLQTNNTDENSNLEVTPESDTTPGIGLPMNPKKLGILIAIALVLWLVSRSLKTNSSQQNQSQTESNRDSDSTEPDDLDGGLIQND